MQLSEEQLSLLPSDYTNVFSPFPLLHSTPDLQESNLPSPPSPFPANDDELGTAQPPARYRSSGGAEEEISWQTELATPSQVRESGSEIGPSHRPLDFSRPSNVCRDTPLHMACTGGYLPVVEVLLSNNTNADAIGATGAAALHLAAQRGFHRIVDILLKSNANPNRRGQDGSTPLHEACKAGSAAVVDSLLRSATLDVSALDAHGRSALHYAALRGWHAIVLRLIQSGCDPDTGIRR